ncbi:hypothetical protein HD806DRAFT_487885 [Xylariaceae sp. AK1471]|nr:hypothetical protein HD806DRAFT_487885 [Xylariaceae sp. AK1471]
MHLILTGATGLVGSGVLDAMLRKRDISRISILSRRPVKMAEDAKDPRINVIIHNDFTNYDAVVLEQLKGADGCVWALGISQNRVSKEDYVTITKTFALSAASAFSSAFATTDRGAPFRFVYVAGGGTTTNPGLFTALHGRTKGETELALANMFKSNPAMKGYSVRPYGVDMYGHDAIKPYVGPRPLAHRAAEYLLGPVVRNYAKDYWAPTEHLGAFLTELALGQHDALEQVGTNMGVEMLDGFAIWNNTGLRKVKGF